MLPPRFLRTPPMKPSREVDSLAKPSFSTVRGDRAMRTLL